MTQGDEMIGDEVGCAGCAELRGEYAALQVAIASFRTAIVRAYRTGKVTGTWETMAEFEDALEALDKVLCGRG